MKTYWEQRFENEGMIWGESPSSTVARAVELFESHNVMDVLVPGAGYGRNTRAFAAASFRVTGVEISESAVHLATEFDRDTQFYTGSFLTESFLEGELPQSTFDGIY